MRLFLIHNRYQQPGGEDIFYAIEKSLLERAGHQVITYVRHNDEIASYSMIQHATLAYRTIWARDSARAIREILDRERPELAHFTNTFPLISPAAYYACQDAGVPVVQSLHNYRLLCPKATFLRDGALCQECLGKSIPIPAVVHKCYRNSRAQSLAVSGMLALHRWLRTWEKQVDAYIATTSFARGKFIEGGLPAEKIFIKPNTLASDPEIRRSGGEYALFVGRLSEEKGLNTLLRAWQSLRDVPLKLVGDGPMAGSLSSSMIDRPYGIELLGRRSNDEVISLMQEARFLVFPSECYENFPMVLAEAFACGLPVIAPSLGAMGEIVEDGKTGLHYRAGDPTDLAEKAKWAVLHPEVMGQMGANARFEYEAEYAPEKNYDRLMQIYEKALSRGRKSR